MRRPPVTKHEGARHTYEAGRKEPLVMGRGLKDGGDAGLPPREASGRRLLPAREAQLRVTDLLKRNNCSYYHNYRQKPQTLFPNKQTIF